MKKNSSHAERRMIADEAIRLVEFIIENDEDRYEYLSSSIEELASGISDMKRMLELVLDELGKHGIDIKGKRQINTVYKNISILG